MRGKNQQIKTKILQLSDSLLILLAFFCSRLLRESLVGTGVLANDGTMGASLGDIYWMLVIVVPFGPIILERYGFYDHIGHKRVWASLVQMLQSLIVIGVMVAVGVIFAKFSPSSRFTLGGAVPLAAIFLLCRQAATQKYMQRKASAEEDLESVIFAGSDEDLASMRAKLPPGVMADWRVVETFDIRNRPVEELPEILHRHSVARVVFAAGHTAFDKVQEAVRVCEVEGVEAWIYANFLQTSIARPTFDFLGSQPMLVFRTTPEVSWALLFKNLMDRGLALLALLVFGLPMLVIALLIRIKSPGPAIFKQSRCGRHGKPFTMLKFRTMHLHADKQLQEIKASSGNEMSGPVFKLENDPRVFPLGRILRKLSLDELPQLINVLMGDMSIVGPRPLPTYEVEEFTNLAHRRRLSVKPGLTCLWQISGRNTITNFDDWVKLDLQYIDNWSLGLDLIILLKTIPVVLIGKGAK